MDKWTLEFEVPEGWKPRTTACWISCPISILVKLGETCNGMKNNVNLCPIARRAKKNGV